MYFWGTKQVVSVDTFFVEGYPRAACNNHVSDFLGWIVFPHPNELNFCMWPSTS